MKEELIASSRDLELLIALNEAIASIDETEKLFPMIYRLLQPVFQFEAGGVLLFSEDRQFVEIFLPGVLVPKELKEAGMPSRVQMRVPVAEVAGFFPVDSREVQRVATRDVAQSDCDDPAQRAVETSLGIDEYLICPLLHSGEVVGHLILTSSTRGRVSERDYPLLRQACRIIAGAVVSTVAYERLARKEHVAEGVLRLTGLLMERRDLADFAMDLAVGLGEMCPFRLLSVNGLPGESPAVSLQCVEGSWVPCPEVPIAWVGEEDASSRLSLRYCDVARLREDLEPHGALAEKLAQHSVVAAVVIRLLPAESRPVDLLLGADSSGAEELLRPGALEQAMPQVLLALQGLMQWERNGVLQRRLQLENKALIEEISAAPGEKVVIGESAPFRHCLSLARQVAPLDSTVLILGETGTGKEVVASYVHEQSKRRGKPFVRINCASLPASLIESELFGHEKGAFTGAADRRIGKFELAHGGTIFLDEAGELPLESQAKLLRVLQERELERLGGSAVIPVDVRVIAATNRSLEEEVRAGRFRADLFFRLNVFPLLLPPLRERQDDIVLLANIFLHRLARRFGRPLRALNREEAALLKAYRWPGNVRELEHTMERAAITAVDGEPNLREFRRAYVEDVPEAPRQIDVAPLEDVVKGHILHALRRSGGRVSGPEGAAALLGLNGKTLDSKMRKYGIRRQAMFTGS